MKKSSSRRKESKSERISLTLHMYSPDKPSSGWNTRPLQLLMNTIILLVVQEQCCGKVEYLLLCAEHRLRVVL